jgi:Protein of unknown function (DUF3237)
MSDLLPDPSLARVYRLEATLGEPLDLGDVVQGRRRIVPLTDGTFTGPELNGTLLPGVSADWQIVLPDGTALANIHYTLQTDEGHLLYVQSHGVRHGSADVLARLAREMTAPGWRAPTLMKTPLFSQSSAGAAVSISVEVRIRDLPGRMSPRWRSSSRQPRRPTNRSSETCAPRPLSPRSARAPAPFRPLLGEGRALLSGRALRRRASCLSCGEGGGGASRSGTCHPTDGGR